MFSWSRRRNAESRWLLRTKCRQRRRSLSWLKIASKITRWRFLRTIRQCRRRRSRRFDDSCPSPALRSTGERSSATRSARSSKRNNNESSCITTRWTARCHQRALVQSSICLLIFERGERVRRFAGEVEENLIQKLRNQSNQILLSIHDNQHSKRLFFWSTLFNRLYLISSFIYLHFTY